MVRALAHSHSIQNSKSFHLKRMFETQERQAHSLVLDDRDTDGEYYNADDKILSRSHCFTSSGEDRQIGFAMAHEKGPVSRFDTNGTPTKSPREKFPSDMELMKERFAKLLLGEDMSGGGKGVSSALAISNAITNLAASIFGEIWKLEPVSPERKARWRKEIGWLLSVTDHIVEFVPSQTTNNGTNMEIMVTRQRADLLVNIPALRKLDAMLLDVLGKFGDHNEFWYPSKDTDEAEQRKDDKWWLPTPKVPPNGLSDMSRKMLQSQKDSVTQVQKAAMAINAQVLSEMEIPESYIESLPKNGRASLGDLIYKGITVEYFSPEQFLSTMDLSTEHKVLDLKNRIEASIVIWKRKMHQKDGKSSWGSTVSLEKRELFEERAETILLLLKQRFPGIAQSSLDISKIQFNKDVGQSVLEGYSRIIESLANTVLSRIEDVLYADYLAQQNAQPRDSTDEPIMDPSPVSSPDYQETAETPISKTTLSDFMGWSIDQGESDMKKICSMDGMEAYFKGENDKKLYKPVVTPKKSSYLENLGGVRSPTARH